MFPFGLLASEHLSKPLYVGQVFLSGNDYILMERLEQERYLMGVIDGFMAADLLSVGSNIDDHTIRASKIIKLEKCRSIITTSLQLHAIVEKYMSNYPENWSMKMPTLVLNCIQKICNFMK